MSTIPTVQAMLVAGFNLSDLAIVINTLQGLAPLLCEKSE